MSSGAAAADPSPFYVLDAARQSHGPYPPSHASVLAASGHLTASTLVCAPGSQARSGVWVPATAVPFLAAAVAAAAAQSAPAAVTETDEAPNGREFVDDDGTKYVWCESSQRYVEADDGAGAGAAGEAPQQPPQHATPPAASGKRKAPEKKAQQAPPMTCVFVQNLPLDVTEQEVATAFAKCGILRRDDEGLPRVKLYADVPGTALVNYMQAASVSLATSILDGTFLRGGPCRADGEPETPLHVEAAKFQSREKEGGDGGGEAGVGATGGRPRDTRPAAKRARHLAKEQRAKLFGWDGVDNIEDAREVTVVLANVFDAREMASAVEEVNARELREKGGGLTAQPKGLKHPLWQELSDDVFAGVEAVGPVEHMKLMHRHPRGIVRVRFKHARDAARCVGSMDGRFFGGRRLEAELWDGVDKHAEKIALGANEDDEDEERRLEMFMKEAEEEE